jgi:hypothetical protein
MSGQPMAFFHASYPYETFRGAMIMPVDWIKRIKWRETVSLALSLPCEGQTRQNEEEMMRIGLKNSIYD